MPSIHRSATHAPTTAAAAKIGAPKTAAQLASAIQHQFRGTTPSNPSTNSKTGWLTSTINFSFPTQADALASKQTFDALAKQLAPKGITVKFERTVQTMGSPWTTATLSYRLDPAKLSTRDLSVMKKAVADEIAGLQVGLRGAKSGDVLRNIGDNSNFFADYAQFIQKQVAPEARLAKPQVLVVVKSLVETGSSKYAKVFIHKL